MLDFVEIEDSWHKIEEELKGRGVSTGSFRSNELIVLLSLLSNTCVFSPQIFDTVIQSGTRF